LGELVDLRLLSILARQPAHLGMLVRELRRRCASQEAIHHSLTRLEAAGLVVVHQGRDRRVYRLTRSGRAELALQRALGRAVARALGGFDEVGPLRLLGRR
jgi:DNA-binding PadR family transcriptional regulator